MAIGRKEIELNTEKYIANPGPYKGPLTTGELKARGLVDETFPNAGLDDRV